MIKEKEKGEFKDFTDGKKKEYKNKVVFLRKSKKGEHLYAFDNDGAFSRAIEGSIVMNISEVKALIAGKFESVKVSIMEKGSEE